MRSQGLIALATFFNMKAGRPKQLISKEKILNIRLSDKEYLALQEAAKGCNYISQWARNVLLRAALILPGSKKLARACQGSLKQKLARSWVI